MSDVLMLVFLTAAFCAAFDYVRLCKNLTGSQDPTERYR